MIIVSGLPRSGTSLMMNILYHNGMKIFTDGKRMPDESNPKGYFEIEEIGEKIKRDSSFLEGKNGCVKILSLFLEHIRGDHKIIFMERDLDENFASIEKMSGEPVSDEEKTAFKKHLIEIKKRLGGKDVVYISYNALIESPESELMKLKKFLPQLDIGKSMEVIDKSLYRNRNLKKENA